MRVTTGEQMGLGSEPTERGLAALVSRLTEGFSKLVTQHLTLARVELLEDARSMGMDVALIAAFVPFILVGYALLCGALVALLAPGLGWAGALALVGAVNLVGGIVGVVRAAGRLKSLRVMDGTAAELNRSVTALAQSPSSSTPPVSLPPETPRGHG